MKNGFTLLEVLIVMAIIGILIALGARGMIIWRENTEASQATEEILAAFKEIQTKAKNNTIPFEHIDNQVEFAQVNSRNYGFMITTDSIKGHNLIYRICWKDLSNGWDAAICSNINTQKLIPQRYSNITINLFPGLYVDTPCEIDKGIIIENLTGKIIDKYGSEVNCYFSTKIVSQNVDYSYFHIFNNGIDRAYP